MWSKLFEKKSQHYTKRHSGLSSRTNITHLTESTRPVSRDSNNLSEELNVPGLMLHHNGMTNGLRQDLDVDAEEEALNPRPKSQKHVRIEETEENMNPQQSTYNETDL